MVPYRRAKIGPKHSLIVILHTPIAKQKPMNVPSGKSHWTVDTAHTFGDWSRGLLDGMDMDLQSNWPPMPGLLDTSNDVYTINTSNLTAFYPVNRLEDCSEFDLLTSGSHRQQPPAGLGFGASFPSAFLDYNMNAEMIQRNATSNKNTINHMIYYPNANS